MHVIDPIENPVRLSWRTAIITGLAAMFFWYLCSLCIIGSAMALFGLTWVWPILLFASLGIAAGGLAAFGNLRLQLHRQRRERGLCIHCGYDLRASSHRCPECGRRIRR